MGAVVNEDAFCLKWNDFHTSLTSTFTELRAESDLLDATIVCEGQALRAHKLVLSASSTVFRQLFRTNNGILNSKSDPVVLMWDVKAEDLKLLFNFMYEGQVNVAQESLNSFLALAERLQVRGLTSNNNNNNRATSSSSVSLLKRQSTNNASPSCNNLVTKRPRASGSSSDDMSEAGVSVPNNAINIKEELKIDSSNDESTSSAMYAACNQPLSTVPFTTQFNQFYENNGHVDQPALRTETAAASSIPVTSANQAFGAGATPIIGGPTEDFSISPQTLVDHKGVVVINTGGHLSSTASAATTAAAASAAAPSGLIIPHSAVVGNSLTTLQQPPQQQQQPSTSSSSSTSSTSSSTTVGRSSTSSNSASSQNNGGTCIHCNKTFRQLRSHIQDVHCPTPTPCPLCGKMFSSKHKMFGHKYRSCPNRTRNLVRHLQDLDQQQQDQRPSEPQVAESNHHF